MRHLDQCRGDLVSTCVVMRRRIHCSSTAHLGYWSHCATCRVTSLTNYSRRAERSWCSDARNALVSMHRVIMLSLSTARRATARRAVVTFVGADVRTSCVGPTLETQTQTSCGRDCMFRWRASNEMRWDASGVRRPWRRRWSSAVSASRIMVVVSALRCCSVDISR